MDEITNVFIQESRDQLAEMESGLLKLEQFPGDRDNLNGIFRAAHTIKGGAGVIECQFLGRFTHGVENVLDRLRNNEIGVTQNLTTLLLACCDHLSKLVDLLATGGDEVDGQLLADGDELTKQLQGYQSTGTAPTPPNSTITMAECNVEVLGGGGQVANDVWHVSVRFGENVLRGGNDPLSIIRYLGSIGELASIETLADAMPSADVMDPESCYLGFELQLKTNASKAEIERAFSFVKDECLLRILPPNSKLSEYLDHIEALPEDNFRLGEILVRSGALTQSELDQALALQHSDKLADECGTQTPLGKILINEQTVQKEVVDAAVGKQLQVQERKAKESRMVRVQADKLDQLIDLVGELVIAGASANLLAQKSKHGDLVEATSVLSRLVENIRDSALQLRMVQVGETFNRFHRVVRDVSKELGKEIELVVSGADTELDKTVIEKIGDPLMHLIRNSLDHGIEPVAARLEKGKPACGRVSLNAYHDSGNVVIEISDDGGGFNKTKIAEKALERGLIQPGQPLSESEIVNLIFEPGFSTADQVSNLSGRGVGMDVVRRNIQALRGEVDVSSTEGIGTMFMIRLPLTLAIIDGFLVGVGRSAYVIPLDSVVECIELKQQLTERNFLNLRGEALPFIRLREVFEITGTPPARESIVVVQFGGHKAGIVVDQLMGEFQTVIKPLGAMFRHLKGIGGSTILGSGEVALILDVAALVQTVTLEEEMVHSNKTNLTVAQKI